MGAEHLFQLRIHLAQLCAQRLLQTGEGLGEPLLELSSNISKDVRYRVFIQRGLSEREHLHAELNRPASDSNAVICRRALEVASDLGLRGHEVHEDGARRYRDRLFAIPVAAAGCCPRSCPRPAG